MFLLGEWPEPEWATPHHIGCSMHSATSKLMFFIHPSVQVREKNDVIGFEAISYCLCLLTFPAQVCRHSAPLLQVHFVWPLMRCCVVCAYVCVWERARQCFTASTAFTGSDWSWMWIWKKKDGEKGHLSLSHSINHDSSFSSTSLVPPSFPFL